MSDPESWARCHYSYPDEHGVHVWCDSPAFTAMPVMDAEGHVFKATMPLCFVHMWLLLRLQAQARQR